MKTLMFFMLTHCRNLYIYFYFLSNQTIKIIDVIHHIYTAVIQSTCVNKEVMLNVMLCFIVSIKSVVCSDGADS